MKLICGALLFLVLAHPVKAQLKDLNKIADSISNEAEILYKSEWASWHGSDIFTQQVKAKQPLSAGYISYDTGKGLNNVFFSKGPDPVVLATISFGYDFNSTNYKLDTINRKLTPAENDLYTIRQAVIADIYKDTLYKRYNHTSLNPIPIINNKTKKVYVLTGPDISGVVVFGNDYLITFDKNNNMVSKRHLHKNIIPVQYQKPSADNTQIDIAGMHIHLPETGDFITATDICTLKLYEKFTTWNQHMVMSKNYVSIWDCKRDKLAIITKEAWDKMNPAANALKNAGH
jgi:hypothetical protein